MKRQIWLAITAIMILGTLGCDRPEKAYEEGDSFSSMGQTPGFDMLSSQIFQPKCAGCHSNFATFSGIMASGSIVAGQPEQSRLYQLVSSGQMPKNGTPLSPNEVSAIYEWILAGAPSSTNVPNTPSNPNPNPPGAPPVPAPGGTPGAISPTFAWIQANVLVPRCVGCHQGTSAPGGYDLSSYASVMAGGRVVANSPATSRFFQRIDNNSMPPGGPALSAEVKQAISTWIANGAMNDAPVGGVVPPPVVALPPLEPTFTSLAANVFMPRCVGCHNSMNATDGVNLQTYAGVRRELVPGDSGESDLYDVVSDNEMPASGPPLTNAQKSALRQWIDAGALNN